MGAGTLGLAFVAGLLSVLSPCVLPLLPLVFGSALSKHAFGPLALAAGLSLSFVAIGLFVATAGFAIGLDDVFFRRVAALIMLGLAATLLVPVLEQRFALAAGSLSNFANNKLGNVEGKSLSAQFLVGALLGAVWSPCVGPTLGAASVLAAQGEDLGQVALTMSLFGLGAALPLLLISTISRELLSRWRGTLQGTSKNAKRVLGAVLAIVAILTLSGADHFAQAWLVAQSPQWLSDLTTAF